MKTKRSPCPVSCTLDLFGDKWTLLVIRDLFAGKSHYNEFAASPEKIATNILADRLKKLEQAAIIEKYPSGKVPGKFAYKLTDKGLSLYPVLEAIADWGLANIAGTRSYVTVEKPAQ